MNSFNFKGDGTVLAGVAGKSITVERLALAALAPVNVNIPGASISPLAVKVQAQDFSSACPFTLAAGADFVLHGDADVQVGGFAEYTVA